MRSFVKSQSYAEARPDAARFFVRPVKRTKKEVTCMRRVSLSLGFGACLGLSFAGCMPAATDETGTGGKAGGDGTGGTTMTTGVGGSNVGVGGSNTGVGG